MRVRTGDRTVGIFHHVDVINSKHFDLGCLHVLYGSESKESPYRLPETVPLHVCTGHSPNQCPVRPRPDAESGGQGEESPHHYEVNGYDVTCKRGHWQCGCSDPQHRRGPCRYMYAADRIKPPPGFTAGPGGASLPGQSAPFRIPFPGCGRKWKQDVKERNHEADIHVQVRSSSYVASGIRKVVRCRNHIPCTAVRRGVSSPVPYQGALPHRISMWIQSPYAGGYHGVAPA